ncbi:MAG TPA: radical SAM protein [Candidatus Sumerlaeota bacterium]|nr:radical SAM protein [Candidatus Sumerlaeota bacterium]
MPFETPIHQIFIETPVRETEITRRVLERVGPQAEVIEVGTAREVLERFAADPSLNHKGKRSLLLTDFHAEPIKPCPGTLNYLCCGYQILNFGQGCPMECAYCILQGYFASSLLVVQANSAAFLKSAADRLRAEPDRFFRLGTGEFADSLALDPLTGYARRLVEFIRDFPNARLELKSKAVHIEEILDADHRGHTICAWSLNTPEAIAREEFRTASLDERLAAAARCQEAGYPLAFHFDPIFYYDGWEDAYRGVIERLFSVARPGNIRWISLGCFRYLPGLEEAIRQRYPRSRFIYADFILGGDRKMRYPQPLRIHIYRKMVEWIRQAGGRDVLVYFCMENAQVWRSVMGHAPRDNEELAGWLDARCRG